MKVYIYGYRGNMAGRYKKIIEALGHEHNGEDIGGHTGWGIDEADALIIATPTASHSKLLRKIKGCGKPILCEKPITKDMGDLAELLEELKYAGTRIEMVSQYDYLKFPREALGPTFYDYWKSGGDGLVWDCINIIYHANGPVTLRNESPLWHCMINGQALSIADMDQAYVDMIDHWLRDPRSDLERIWHAHVKVRDLEAQLAV